MKIRANHIETPIGFLPAPLSPDFPRVLGECKTNEDLFKLLESKRGFVNPDVFAEIEARGLYQEYKKWRDHG